jgi:hypothetical protein
MMHVSLLLREKKDTILTMPKKLFPQLKYFKFFLVSLAVWYDALFQIRVVCKSMQSQNFEVCKSMESSEGCHEFLEEYAGNVLGSYFSSCGIC